jgi:CheY-like chemotaxis protein
MSDGLDDIIAAETVLSEVDGLAGRLVIRGRSLDDLAGRTRFEDAARLLFDGFFADLPADLARPLGEARVAVFEEGAPLDERLLRLTPVEAMRALTARLADGDGADRGPGKADSPELQRSVMVVESDARMQHILREGLKKAGYRVLLTSDPERAFDLARQDAGGPDCLVLNAQDIGESALAVFNRLAEDPSTQEKPAILLLDEPQHGWQSRAVVAEHRVVLPMPITMKQLRGAIEKLLPSEAQPSTL